MKESAKIQYLSEIKNKFGIICNNRKISSFAADGGLSGR